MGEKLSISIAMTTYNGSMYIEEQLASIYHQTRKPDQVIICDDGSKDDTVEKIHAFIENNALSETWSVFINPKNLGYVENFLQSARRCTGDFIFFSDQDDIWALDKLELMEQVFLRYNPSAVVSKYSMIDSEGKPHNTLYSFYKNAPSIKKLRRLSHTQYLRLLCSSGKALGFKSTLLDELEDQVHTHNLTYDTPIGAIALFHEGFMILHKPLVQFRVHTANASAPSTTISHRTSNREHLITSVQHILKMHTFVYEAYNNKLSKRDCSQLLKSIAQQQSNLVALQQESFPLSFFCKNITFNPAVNKVFSLLVIWYGIKYRLQR
ncbi:glycosyltransferase [uncultured Sphaerochaeta sp.]|uniref:glycosyltransferase n=1 Tax=uncultured Sphaerochaeta sp. TaxID=886478 RepID=UPI002AA8B843|nr:glycosyltransferase [uncultured Sphaerochaeta sp.]